MARDGQRRVLETALGNPDIDERDAEQVRDVVRDCGALTAIERRVVQHHDRALTALDRVHQPAREALVELADRALFRDG
jgi:geranylgeranyl diphosphate synthase type I